jgi:hypothetical protein
MILELQAPAMILLHLPGVPDLKSAIEIYKEI